MTIRIYTSNTYMDLRIKEITSNMLIAALEEGNSVAVTKEDGSTFIINMINVVAIEILSTSSIPPITKE